jgi:F0F1-type ATP synthase alpha subunit
MAESSNLYDALLKQIEGYQSEVESVEAGIVEEVGDGIARVSGLNSIRLSELVRFSSGTVGIAFNLETSSVGVIVLGDASEIQEGDEVRPSRWGRVWSVALLMRWVRPSTARAQSSFLSITTSNGSRRALSNARTCSSRSRPASSQLTR